jgi:hypothetical protein
MAHFNFAFVIFDSSDNEVSSVVADMKCENPECGCDREGIGGRGAGR